MEVQTYLYTEAICKMEDLHRSKLSELQSFAEFALATHRNLRCLIMGGIAVNVLQDHLPLAHK